MEPVLALLTGIFLTVAVYLLLSKSIIRDVAWRRHSRQCRQSFDLHQRPRPARSAAGISGQGWMCRPARAANPLPQALILTAIVISFSFFAFLLVLSWRAYSSLGTDNTDDARGRAETIVQPPPLGY